VDDDDDDDDDGGGGGGGGGNEAWRIYPSSVVHNNGYFISLRV